MSATLELTRNLIARRSVTPADGGCQEVIAARLEPLGFGIEKLRFGGVDNLWATRGQGKPVLCFAQRLSTPDRKSTRLNSSHTVISYAVFCFKKKKKST